MMIEFDEVGLHEKRLVNIDQIAFVTPANNVSLSDEDMDRYKTQDFSRVVMTTRERNIHLGLGHGKPPTYSPSSFITPSGGKGLKTLKLWMWLHKWFPILTACLSGVSIVIVISA